VNPPVPLSQDWPCRPELLNKFTHAVVNICLDAETAERMLPGECAGQFNFETTHGSNTNMPSDQKKAPRAIILAANVSDGDEKKLAKLIHEMSPSVPVLKATKFDVIKAGGIGPDPVAIAKVFRKKLSKEGL
jgi:hypothetical protein